MLQMLTGEGNEIIKVKPGNKSLSVYIYRHELKWWHGRVGYLAKEIRQGLFKMEHKERTPRRKFQDSTSENKSRSD